MGIPSTETSGNLFPKQHLRVSTFGRFRIEWADPQTGQVTPLPSERLHGQNAGTALGLFKSLLSCPGRFATRAWLNEQFWPDSTVKRAEERLNDVVSSLRTLLRPTGSSEMLVHFVYGTSGRGAGYRLDSYPQLWCDADAFEWYVKHALLLDQRGQDSTACWEHAYVLAERGLYLPEQIEEDWSRPRRDYLSGLVRDCVHRWTAILRQTGHVGGAILRLRSYWLEHPTDEDALCLLLGMFGECERFGEAEECYAKAQAALAEENHAPDDRTIDAIEAVRALNVQQKRPAEIPAMMRQPLSFSLQKDAACFFQTPPTLPSFRVFLCGGFRAERLVGTRYEPVRTAEWGGSNYPRLLLKALLCCPGRQARRETLLEMLWPEGEMEQATGNLNAATTKLRKALQPSNGQESLLITEADSTLYRLPEQQGLWVDSDAALALLKEAECLGRTRPEALRLLEDAVALFQQGTFLQDEEGQWAAGRRATVEQARYRCRLWLAEAYEQQTMFGQAETTLSSLLEEDLTDEDVLCRLMFLLHQQGMTHQALRLYQRTSEACAQDGLALSEATKTQALRLRERSSEVTEDMRALTRRTSGSQIAPMMMAFPPTAFPAFLPLQEQGSFSSFSHALTGRIIETFCEWEGISPMTFDPLKRATLQNIVAAFSALPLGQQLVNVWFEKNEVTEDAPSHTYSFLDIDLVSRHIDALQTLLLKGEARFVLQASQEVYQRIQQAERSQQDVRLAEIALQAGLLVANAQEYALPWYQRDKAIIQTYDSIEQNVLRKYPEKGRFDRAYAQILAKRGRQHRVLWLFEYCERECARGLALANQLNDYPLRIHFLCERAHIEATSGDDTVWMRELETARQGVLDLPWIEREKAFHQIDYMQGEGYKRLAFHTRKDFSLDLRQKYAILALDHLASWDGITIEVPGFEALVAALSRTQCFVLLDPEQAIRFAEQQTPLIETYYPTLLAKIHRILFLAQQRLQMNDQQFAQVFQGTTYAAYQSGSNLL